MFRYRPHHVRRPLTRPMRERIQRRVAPIMPAIFRPSQVPFVNAWRALEALWSSSSGRVTRPAVRVSSSSGHRSLEVASEAGMLMTQDEIRA